MPEFLEKRLLRNGNGYRTVPYCTVTVTVAVTAYNDSPGVSVTGAADQSCKRQPQSGYSPIFILTASNRNFANRRITTAIPVVGHCGSWRQPLRASAMRGTADITHTPTTCVACPELPLVNVKADYHS